MDKFEKYQLPNGMQVLLVESHKSPVVSAQVWVNTGSVDERKGQEGITHFIEHLLFKQTRQFKVGEIATLVEGSGGQLNAYTSFDRTVFYVTIASQFSHIAIEILSDMILYPKFDPKDIDDERQVVIEEIHRAKDSPHSQSSDLLFSTLYFNHPYRHPILGYKHNIEKLTPHQIVRYYQNHYFPQNITLIITGDFDSTAIKPAIEKAFGPFKKQKEHKKSPKKKHFEPIQTSPRVRVQAASFEETHIHLAWKLPFFDHPDIPALEALSVILGQGDSSRFYQHLRLQNLYVNTVSCYTYTLQQECLFVISCELPKETIDSALDGLLEKLLFMDPPTLEELQKAITMIESEEYYCMETVDGLSEKYGFYETLLGDPHYVETFLRQIKSLTTEDLVRVAKTYLTPQKLALCMMSKKTNTAKLEAKLQEWLKIYGIGYEILQQAPIPQNILPTPYHQKTPQKARIEEVHLDSGARLYLYKSSQTPTVSMDLGFAHTGLLAEPKKLQGLSYLVKRAWPSDTSHYTESALKGELDQLATVLQAFSGKNTLGLHLTTLSSSLRKAFALLKDVLQNPLFSENVIEREKIAMQKKRDKRNDNPPKIAIRTFEQTLFAGHPYNRDPLGTQESLGLITYKDVISYWKNTLQAQNMVISVVGDFDSAWLQDQIKLIEEQFPLKMASSNPHPILLEPLKTSQKVFKQSDKAQSSIILGYRGLNLKSKYRFAIQVLEAILSGQGGRLFLELRDKASLAYTVVPVSLTGPYAGFFAIYIGCLPEKSQKAIAMMKAEIHKLCEKHVLTDELERAKKHLIGRYNIALQKNASLSSAIFFREVYGISHQEIFDYAQHIQGVTSDHLLALSQEIFTQKEVLVLYGPVKPWK